MFKTPSSIACLKGREFLCVSIHYSKDFAVYFMYVCFYIAAVTKWSSLIFTATLFSPFFPHFIHNSLMRIKNITKGVKKCKKHSIKKISKPSWRQNTENKIVLFCILAYSLSLGKIQTWYNSFSITITSLLKKLPPFCTYKYID